MPTTQEQVTYLYERELARQEAAPTPVPPLERVARALRGIRAAGGYSQTALADRSGVSASRISAIENAGTPGPRVEELWALFAALKVAPENVWSVIVNATGDEV